MPNKQSLFIQQKNKSLNSPYIFKQTITKRLSLEKHTSWIKLIRLIKLN